MALIEATDIAKRYPALGGKRALLGRGGMGRLFRTTPPVPMALSPLSLTVEAGEALGIIGRNGSGKSTLLKLIAGVTAPSEGTLKVHGRVASLLELGAGFHPMLTGRENVYLNAGLLGMRHAQVRACFDAIVDFAELAEHIDRTVDTYSSGMFVRLAFSVAIHTDPDVFLVDEVLSVGDEAFQRKCRARILALKEAGKTILFVSHDLGTVQTLCDRVLLLEQGEVLSRGDTQATIDYYLRQIGQAQGIHRVASGDVEALFNHGRLSLFHRQREVTAPLGLKVQFFSMGSYHESTSAEWTLESPGETEFTAVGTFPRLPVRLYLTVSLVEGRLSLSATWENTQPLDLSYVALQCFLRSAYTTWYAGTQRGAFPPIAPQDHQWSTVATVPRNTASCAVQASADGALPPLLIEMDDTHECARFQLDNTDYMAQARIVHLTEAIPTGAVPLPPGRRTLGTLVLDPTCDDAALRQVQRAQEAAERIESGPLMAQYRGGALALSAHEQLLTDTLHLHAQLRCGALWMLGTDFTWDVTRETDDTLVITGRSARLAGSLCWEVTAATPHHLGLVLTLHNEERLSLSEYNLSLCLEAGYNAWQSAEASGVFGDAGALGTGWTHLNPTYEAGPYISATGPERPKITLHADESLGTVFPTAIRTDTAQDGRVVQLLCSPGRAGAFALEPGAHVLFSGRLWTEDPTSS